MAILDIDDLINAGQWASMHKWTLKFATIPNLYTGPDLQGLNIRCESVSLPKVSVPSVEIVIRGHKVKQSGIADYGNTLTLTLFETTDMYVTRCIKAWRELTWQTKTGRSENKSDLSCVLHLERFDNTDTAMYNYEIYGCYLEDYDHGGDLDASTADAQKPTMTISFDYFRESEAGFDLRNPASGFGSTGTSGTAEDFA